MSFQNVVFEHMAPECLVSVILSLSSHHLNFLEQMGKYFGFS